MARENNESKQHMKAAERSGNGDKRRDNKEKKSKQYI